MRVCRPLNAFITRRLVAVPVSDLLDTTVLRRVIAVRQIVSVIMVRGMGKLPAEAVDSRHRVKLSGHIQTQGQVRRQLTLREFICP